MESKKPKRKNAPPDFRPGESYAQYKIRIVEEAQVDPDSPNFTFNIPQSQDSYETRGGKPTRHSLHTHTSRATDKGKRRREVYLDLKKPKRPFKKHNMGDGDIPGILIGATDVEIEEEEEDNPYTHYEPEYVEEEEEDMEEYEGDDDRSDRRKRWDDRDDPNIQEPINHFQTLKDNTTTLNEFNAINREEMSINEVMGEQNVCLLFLFIFLEINF